MKENFIMKKIVALILLVCTVLAVVSCGMPTDPDKIADKLEASGYDVNIIEKNS